MTECESIWQRTEENEQIRINSFNLYRHFDSDVECTNQLCCPCIYTCMSVRT